MRTVHGDVDTHAVRQCRRDRWQDLADLGIGRHDVGARYREYDDTDSRGAIVQTNIANVLVGIVHFGDIVQKDRRVVAVGDDEIPVIRRYRRLIVGSDLELLVALLDVALGAVGVGGRHCRPHVFHANAVTVQFIRFELDADGGQCGAAQRDLTDAADLGQLLLNHRTGTVVEL